jgi:hypothetical protein
MNPEEAKSAAHKFSDAFLKICEFPTDHMTCDLYDPGNRDEEEHYGILYQAGSGNTRRMLGFRYMPEGRLNAPKGCTEIHYIAVLPGDDRYEDFARFVDEWAGKARAAGATEARRGATHPKLYQQRFLTIFIENGVREEQARAIGEIDRAVVEYRLSRT